MIVCSCCIKSYQEDEPSRCDIRIFLQGYNLERQANGLPPLSATSPMTDICAALRHYYLTHPPVGCPTHCRRCASTIREAIVTVLGHPGCKCPVTHLSLVEESEAKHHVS